MSNVGRFKYGKLAKYPHMPAEDILTWEKFLEKYPDEYLSVDYDVHCGELTEHSDKAADLGIAGSEAVNQYKIDVVGYKKNSIDLIELKGKAVPAAIGQLAMYKSLYDKEVKPTVQTYPVIIAREESPFMADCCKNEGVLLILV